jgi:hypothetical protein
MSGISFHLCQHVGISGTTKVVVHHVQSGDPAKDIPDVFEARVGIAIMGDCNSETTEDSDPFSSRFRDNFARGFGLTEEQAIRALKADMNRTADGLFS